MLLENLSFLIVSPDLDSRTKLREVLRTFVYKGTIRQERALRGLAATFQPQQLKSNKVDTLFIASSFGQEAILAFIHECQSIGAKIPPIVIFMNTRESETSTAVANLYLEGVDGFISEPYSSEEVLRLVQTLKNQPPKAVATEAKLRKAAEFLLHDAMAHVDEMAKQLMAGEEAGGYPLKNLRAVSKRLEAYSSEHPELYADLVSHVFQKAKPASEAELNRKSRQAKKLAQHPGAVIREMMKARNLTAERLLGSLRIDPQDFDALLKEQRGIDDVIAKELARILGMTPTEWVRLQREYDARSQKRKK